MLAVGGLGLGLIGSGIHAAITDGGTVTATVHTGALSCAVSSTDPLGVPSSDSKSVTVTEPPIASSNAGSLYLADLTVTNTGAMPEVVHWTETTAGTVIWQPNTVAGRGSFGVAIGTGIPGDPTRLDKDITLAAGAHQTYGQGGNGVGFQWTALGNGDFGATASATFTATCGEVPPPPPPSSSKVSFVGVANMAFVAPPSTSGGPTYMWIGLPNNNQALWGGAAVGAGVLTATSTAAFGATGPWLLKVTTTLVTGGSPATVSCTGKTPTSFTGCTTLSGGGMLNGATISVPPTTLVLPAGSTTGDYALVMTYGATGGNNPMVPAGYTALTSNAGAGNMQTDLSYRVLVAGDTSVPATATGYGEEVAVYRGVAGVGAKTYNGGNVVNVGGAAYPLNCSALSLTKTDGSSWVACMGGDGFATTNASAMVFDSNTTNRSSGNASTATGLADTNTGVTSWAQVGWTGDNFPMPGSHAVVVHSIELLSK